MMAVVQRVSRASVKVKGTIVGEIGSGLLILLGVRRDDSLRDVEYLADKVLHLRVFPDDAGKMNRSVLDIAGAILVVSQFTLYGDTAKGHLPSFSQAAPASEAKSLYEAFLQRCAITGLRVAAGVFQAEMEVELTNVGPVTLLCRSEK